MSRSILGLSLIGLLGLGGCASESDTASPPGSSTGASSSTGGETNGSGGSANTGGSTTGAGGSAAGGAATGNGGSSTGNGGSSTGNGGSSTGNGGNPTSGGSTGSGGSTTGTPTYDQVKGWIDAYKAAHPGRAGDINANGDTSPEAQQLRSLCGPDQLPVIPQLAWEYGGNDHAWINPDQSPLVICVYIAVNPSTDHWKYDAGADHITADAYVLFPDQNPCNGRTGADQVLGCIGDQTNLEILVDTSSINDGANVGLQLANSSTDVYLILSDGSKVLLYQNV